VGLHGKHRRREELGGKAAIDLGHNPSNSRGARDKRIEHGFFPPRAVEQIGFDRALRIVEAAAVARQENIVVAVEQNFERGDVIGHAPFRWRDDGRVPRHHVIAREDEAAAFEREAEMIGRMARRVDRGQRPVFARDGVAALERDVGHEIIIDEVAARRAVLERDFPGGGIARIGGGKRPGFGFELGEAIDVIAMRVRREDVGDRSPGRRFQNGGAMRVAVRSGIDDGKRRGADEISVGALKRERARIIRDEANDARSHRRRRAVIERHLGLEIERIQTPSALVATCRAYREFRATPNIPKFAAG